MGELKERYKISRVMDQLYLSRGATPDVVHGCYHYYYNFTTLQRQCTIDTPSILSRPAHNRGQPDMNYWSEHA